jgi:hypothetical protein
MPPLRPEPGQKETAAPKRPPGSRMARRTFLLGVGGMAALGIARLLQKPEYATGGAKGMITFDTLENGAELIEREVGVRTGEAAAAGVIGARIVRIGKELGVRIANVLYRVTNVVLKKPATEMVTSMRYDKAPDEIVIEAKRTIPPFKMSGVARMTRARYEEIVRALAAEHPKRTDQYVEVAYKADLLPDGKTSIALQLEQDGDTGIA